MRNTADVKSGKTIAFSLQSKPGKAAINPLVAFYDIHGRKRVVLFFYFVPDNIITPVIIIKFFIRTQNKIGGLIAKQ
jgi:hypothetical protein